ncbi:MAG: copper resistance protein CopC [Nitrosomonas sp.]|nr:copper resistance protein CopC [Nitrosomonas sp.]MDP1950224.1 copper resistance protein CopC [Nitrosomonas sp.]
MELKTFLVADIKRVLFPTVVTMMLLAVLVQGSPAQAHATLVKSEPPRRATLSTAPKQIQLWFNEEIEGSYASISVLDSNKNSITEANPELVYEDLKSVVLPLPDIAPGRYTVKYRILSVDGHVVESAYDFTVKNIAQKK